MGAQGVHSVSTYRRHFGSWSAALEEAGFDPDDYDSITSDQLRYRITDEELIFDLRCGAVFHGHSLVRRVRALRPPYGVDAAAVWLGG
ncbi:hypothetical protein C500_14525 [Natrialba magadii ATCC 43099]|uniref:Uncharacterized protein n=2 Tax=Natrialba magadii TaxID=13769 RepID=L9UQV1_NATMM|nr:hypothetical protein C500_14525 [Natrialba magadii ATCC 43099]